MTEKHLIDVENGEEIAATHAEADSEIFIFVCHGFGGNRSRQKEYIKLADEGFNVVTLDFRGNGESDGDFIDQNLSSRIEDLKTVVDYFDPEKTVLFGTSFGGKVVFHTVPKLNPDAVIGKSPVTYSEIMDKFREVVEEKGEFEYIEGKPIDGRFFEDLDSYKFEEEAGKIDFPVAIFHGGSDTTVHPEYSFQAAQEIDSDVILQKFKGEKHSFSENGKEKLLTAMSDWLKRLF
jgi:pimeloyl-ACP methyl ester carboxylesterase